MSLDKTIRENLDGKYLTIYTDNFNESVEYALQMHVNQIHLIGISGVKNIVDFKELKKISDTLQIISFIGGIENIINFESIYSLKNIQKIYFQQRQKFVIDISRFPEIMHLGSEYWKGLTNFNKAYSLKSMVLFKFTDMNLNQISGLQKLQILHIYSSKIQTLDGIETLPIEELSLVRNNYLEDIQAIKELKMLKELNIEKCKNIVDYNLVDSLNNKIRVNIIK